MYLFCLCSFQLAVTSLFLFHERLSILLYPVYAHSPFQFPPTGYQIFSPVVLVSTAGIPHSSGSIISLYTPPVQPIPPVITNLSEALMQILPYASRNNDKACQFLSVSNNDIESSKLVTLHRGYIVSCGCPMYISGWSGRPFRLWRISSSGMWRRVDLVRTDVSEKWIASIIKVKGIMELGTR
jgi:hypothetical protein